MFAMDTKIGFFLVGMILLCGCVGEKPQREVTVLPAGGLDVGLSPRNVSVSPGGDVSIMVEVFNNENIADVVHVYLAVDDLPSGYQADLGWFNWTDQTVEVASGGVGVIPLGVSVPGNASGVKAFRVVAASVLGGLETFNTGLLQVRG
jgi:hypothetical protein